MNGLSDKAGVYSTQYLIITPLRARKFSYLYKRNDKLTIIPLIIILYHMLLLYHLLFAEMGQVAGVRQSHIPIYYLTDDMSLATA